MKEYRNWILKVYEIHFFNLTNPFGQKAGSGGKGYRRARLPARPPSSPLPRLGTASLDSRELYRQQPLPSPPHSLNKLLHFLKIILKCQLLHE